MTEISEPAQLQGYRSMWHTLRIKYQLHVPRSTVARLLREIDPGNLGNTLCRKRTSNENLCDSSKASDLSRSMVTWFFWREKSHIVHVVHVHVPPGLSPFL